MMAVPVVASVVWQRPAEDASVEDPVELIAGLALVALVGGLILAGVGVLLWPVAVAMLAGVLVAFGAANLYVIVLATGRAHEAASFDALRGGLIGSLGLSLLEIVGLAALRSVLAANLGFSWGF